MRINRDRAAWIAALAFVLLTLIALIAIPLVVQSRVNHYRVAIEGSEPARTLLMGLQFNLVREMSSLNQFARLGDEFAAQTFREAREQETRIWDELAPLAAGLGIEVHEKFVEARTVATLWHIRLNEDELLRRGSGGLVTLDAADVRRRFEEVLRATNELDSLIVSATQRNRMEIEAAEQAGIRLTLMSGAIAALAALVVGGLVFRIRRLAIEAERRRTEIAEALAESAREAEARQRLMRGITHDVKNPLGAARGYAELLAMQIKGPLNPEQEKLTEGVERSIDGALAIISDLLDLARADSGGISVHRITTNLNDIVCEAVDDHRAAVESAGHTIEFQPHGEVLQTYTDPVRVRQVLDNVISNAIKYTPAPGRIVVRTDGDAPDAPFDARAIAVRVSDTGPGVPPEQKESIFDEFTRLDDAGKMKGHGLGLSIARRIARMLGGELGIAESVQPGATFVLWLPQREHRSAGR